MPLIDARAVVKQVQMSFGSAGIDHLNAKGNTFACRKLDWLAFTSARSPPAVDLSKAEIVPFVDDKLVIDPQSHLAAGDRAAVRDAVSVNTEREGLGKRRLN